MSVSWYLKWKYYLLRKQTKRTLQNPKNLVPVFMAITFLSILYQNVIMTYVGMVITLSYWLYLDFKHTAIPKKWKRYMVIKDYEKRNSVPRQQPAGEVRAGVPDSAAERNRVYNPGGGVKDGAGRIPDKAAEAGEGSGSREKKDRE